MKITGLETIRIEERPNLLWLQVHTDEGLVGLGETFIGAATVEAHVHEYIAPRVIGRDPLQIDRLAHELIGYVGFRSSGAEMRGNSAFDIALWDLFGKATGQPIAQLLGGFTRDMIRTYNTCAGPDYIKQATGQSTANYALGGDKGAYDDLNGFLNCADELAQSLLEEGITALKIWPFDTAAERTGGQYISGPDLAAALQPFEKIRSAVGDKIDIMVEFHSMWQLLPAIHIAKALGPFGTFWHEDPIKMDSLASLKRYASASPAPVSASETLATRWGFRDLLETDAAGIVMLDISWCGGLSEARKIAAMAQAWHLPVAPHDCTGPVVLAASTHLSLNAPNALIQERRACFSSHLVSRSGDVAAADRKRHDLRAAGARSGTGTPSRARSRLHHVAQNIERRHDLRKKARASAPLDDYEDGPMCDLTARRALVTGGLGTIGAAMADRFKQAGAQVTILDRPDSLAHCDFEHLGVDLNDLMAAEEAVGQAGPFDILINNAALIINKPHEAFSLVEYEDQIRVNSSAAFILSRVCARQMKENRWGKIVNLTSITLNGQWDGYVPYVTSKGAMLGLTKGLARELGPHGINVNAIAPGAVRSEAENRVFADRLDEYNDWVLEHQCLKERIEAGDVAELALFLCSDAARMITGQNVQINGGW